MYWKSGPQASFTSHVNLKVILEWKQNTEGNSFVEGKKNNVMGSDTYHTLSVNFSLTACVSNLPISKDFIRLDNIVSAKILATTLFSVHPLCFKSFNFSISIFLSSCSYNYGRSQSQHYCHICEQCLRRWQVKQG